MAFGFLDLTAEVGNQGQTATIESHEALCHPVVERSRTAHVNPCGDPASCKLVVWLARELQGH